MNLIEIKNLEMKYFDKVLYKNVNLEINKGDKIILVGENGKGKSTLIKLITDEEIQTNGQIIISEELKISVLNQFSPIDEGLTVKEILNIPFKKVIELEKEIIELSMKMMESDEIMEEYLARNEQFESLGGYDYIITQEKFIKAFDFQEIVDRPFSTLSGGEKQHMLLAVSLFDEGELIILDEPITFFDKKKNKWLVEFINESLKTFLIVAHDEDFAKKVANKVFDIDNNEIVSYETNYINYLKEKENYIQSQIDENSIIDEQLLLKKQAVARKLKWIEQTEDKRSHAVTVRRLRKEIEKLESQKFVFEDETSYEYTIKQEIEEKENTSEIKWIEFKDVKMQVEEKLLYEKVNFTFNKNDRIVITGDNGAGKSTFLNIINGEKEVASGDVYINEEVNIGYITQDIFFSDNNMTVFDYCKRVCRLGDIVLEEYIDKLFDEDKDFRIKRLYMLSGGESKRLQILAHILSGVNLLILDEPTTFMDSYSKSKLMELLKDFKGGIILVTHDLPLIRAITYKRYRIENNRRGRKDWGENEENTETRSKGREKKSIRCKKGREKM